MLLQQLFGSNAYQDADYLVVDKRDFTNLSIAINTAESLLVAIVLNAHKHFEGTIVNELDLTITNESSVSITYSNSNIYELLNIFHWKKQFILSQSQSKIMDTFVVESYEVQLVYRTYNPCR